MQLDKETLSRYRLERAKEDLKAAGINHDSANQLMQAESFVKKVEDYLSKKGIKPLV